MKKIILIIIFIFLPITVSAQFDYLDEMINEDRSIYDLTHPETVTPGQTQVYTMQSIDISWSADTYVPYDYPGRALPSIDSFIEINLTLNLSRGNPANLQYSWFVDGNFEESQSGYGRMNFKFGIRRDAGEYHSVLVKIFDDTGMFYLEKSLIIPIVAPEIIVYPSIKNPDFSELALKKIVPVKSNKKAYFTAKPFFFSVQKPTDLNYYWSFSDQEAINASGLNANVLTLIAPENKNEKAIKTLNLSVSNNQLYPKQTTSRTFIINQR